MLPRGRCSPARSWYSRATPAGFIPSRRIRQLGLALPLGKHCASWAILLLSFANAIVEVPRTHNDVCSVSPLAASVSCYSKGGSRQRRFCSMVALSTTFPQNTALKTETNADHFYDNTKVRIRLSFPLFVHPAGLPASWHNSLRFSLSLSCGDHGTSAPQPNARSSRRAPGETVINGPLWKISRNSKVTK